MPKKSHDYLQLLLIAGPILLLDQLSKAWVRAALPVGQVAFPELSLTQSVRITHALNYGAAGGIFQRAGWVFLLISAAVSLAIILYYPRVRREDKLMRLSLGVLLAGASGNLIDRLTVGHVTDFISIGALPVFNIADLAVLVGAILLAAALWRSDSGRTTKVEPDGKPL